MIRWNTDIKGIRNKGGVEHKISLFADDILLYVIDPNISMMALVDNLNKYGQMSGYLTNKSKSVAMMLARECSTEVKEKKNFRWTVKGFRYLGMTVTPTVSWLYEANCGKLIRDIKKDLERWEVLPLDLLGRVETVRMNILPRLLFLFRLLPIVIPAANFKALYKNFLRFLWTSKKVRIKYNKLKNPKEEGGLNMPNLRNYYWASQLRGVIMWITKDFDTIWVGMERRACMNIPLESLPFADVKTTKKLKIKKTTGSKERCKYGHRWRKN